MTRFPLAAAVLAAALPSLVFADPPKLAIPPEVRPAGQYVELVPDTDAASVAYVGLDAVDAVPNRFLSDKRVFLLNTLGLKDGRYRFAAVAAGKDGSQVRQDFAVVVGDSGPPPVKPVDPGKPADPAGPLYFLVVQPDGPASPTLTKLLGDPAWDALRGKGFSMKNVTATEADGLGVPTDDVKLPAVAVLRLSADRKKSVMVRPPAALPTTGDGILKLPEGL